MATLEELRSAAAYDAAWKEDEDTADAALNLALQLQGALVKLIDCLIDQLKASNTVTFSKREIREPQSGYECPTKT